MVGIGYDIHRLVKNRALYLGGVKIDFNKGLIGHSDGDVVIHAICDALLGAANLGDIGLHFPPDDDSYKDIASSQLLTQVKKFLDDSALSIKNIDVTVIAEAPKILPYVKQMKKHIARTLEIPDKLISIKGKTNEGLGDIGAGEAIAAIAICEITGIHVTSEG
jgi:2-C-methyl-D-erythritol 2,4-cyclodiphosphate synthase